MALIENQIDAVIMTAFPQYKQEEIEQWSFDKLASMFAKAEWALKILRGVPVEIQFADPTTQAPQNKMPEPPNPTKYMY